MTRRSLFKFEICANSVESCIAAQNAGADRVELCAGIPEGGTTPSYGEIKTARRLLTSTRLHVIIRPRGGDFLYSHLEIERMLCDIAICKQLGVDGVVFGCLLQNGDIDIENTEKMCSAAKGMSTTFHRAFDLCANPMEAMKQLSETGMDRILTSGQAATAEEGTKLLKQLQKESEGKIKILAGCGVNEKNIKTIYQETGITEFHFSAREQKKSEMICQNESIYMGARDADENTILVTSEKRVRDTILALTS